MENDEEEFLEFIELHNRLEYFDCLPICLYNGIWYVYYERPNQIEVLDYHRTDIPVLPRHFKELVDEEIPNELFYGKRWLFIRDSEILDKDCTKLAHFLDKKYQEKFVYRYHFQKEISATWNLTEEDFDLISNFLG